MTNINFSIFHLNKHKNLTINSYSENYIRQHNKRIILFIIVEKININNLYMNS
jgi:hypothetical protein